MPSKIKSRVNKKYSKRRGNKKVTKRTRVKRGKGPGTKQLISIVRSVTSMLEDTSGDKRRLEDEVRIPLLNSTYGKYFLNGIKQGNTDINSFRELNILTETGTIISNGLQELQELPIDSDETVIQALKLSASILMLMPTEIRKVKKIRDNDKSHSSQEELEKAVLELSVIVNRE